MWSLVLVQPGSIQFTKASLAQLINQLVARHDLVMENTTHAWPCTLRSLGSSTSSIRAQVARRQSLSRARLNVIRGFVSRCAHYQCKSLWYEVRSNKRYTISWPGPWYVTSPPRSVRKISNGGESVRTFAIVLRRGVVKLAFSSPAHISTHVSLNEP